MSKKVLGFFAGACGVFSFYLTVAVIVVFVILDRIEAETNGHASLFGTRYQTLLFVLDIIFTIGMIIFIVLAVMKKGKKGIEYEKKNA